MIIDSHTHIFPEKIAEKTLQHLSSIIGLAPSMNGTDRGLSASMEDAGVDLSIILPVVTKVSQFDSILRFASMINETYAERNEGALLSMAGIHPDDPDYKDRLRLIKREGFSGIKIHPDYQHTLFSDLSVKRILYTAEELGLTVVTHAGFDPVDPVHVHCTPPMVLEVLRDVAPTRLVLAHMGSNENYAESEELLCGQDVYFDSSYSILRIPDEDFVRMVRKHGADRILFASDCPWAGQKACVEKLKQSSLTEDEKNLIFSENAKKVFSL